MYNLGSYEMIANFKTQTLRRSVTLNGGLMLHKNLLVTTQLQ